ncbi:MAG: UDPGP type 1 family protein [Phycisphaeraceae bacterium]|nr:UDPGP type 1 family protein [Phycisphaeraceae bacterium]
MMTTSHTRVDPAKLDRIRAELGSIDRLHLLEGWDRLAPEQQIALVAQLEEVDWPEVGRLIQSHVLNKPEFDLPEKVEPAPWYPYLPPASMENRYREARELGHTLIRQGKVAAFTVAGGQGTRLGWDGPKGTYPATPIRKLSLFGCFAEYIDNIQKRFDVTIPWYIMTSPANDQATRRYLREQAYFGLSEDQVMMFPQQMMPALDRNTGKVLMSGEHEIALSPNGHGGSLKALHTSGAIDDMKKRGVEQISYIQVDNPLVRVIDPLFIGLHAMDDCQMSSKMLPKRDPFEKLGNFCLIDGRMTVIEYSDLPDELAVEKGDDGRLRFLAGSIAIHVIRADFVESLNTRPGGFALPFHRAEKKVPYFDRQSGRVESPLTPNAVKLETFVFDALPLTERSIIYETSRADEFAPIKNADGPDVLDCPGTSIDLQVRRAADWLDRAGCPVPRKIDGAPDAMLEISQRLAIYPEDLKPIKLPDRIKPGASILLA